MSEIAFTHPSRAIMTPLPPPTLDPSQSLGPDLSHLTDQERQIIESVMVRQKQVEAEEAQVLKKKQDEVVILENAIRLRNEQQKKLGLEMEATCQICLKTKFADGVGHICNYCGTRCCARCGGKVALRSNKNIWVCILCRKKQELLIKTGQWIHSSMANRLKQLESESEFTSTPLFERFIQFTSAGIGAQNQQHQQQQHKDQLGPMGHRRQPQLPQQQQQQQQHSSFEQQMLNSGNVCLNFIRRSSLGILPGSPKTHPIRELRRQFSHESQAQQHAQQQQQQIFQRQSMGGRNLCGFRARSFDADEGNGGSTGHIFSGRGGGPTRRHQLPQNPPLKVQLLQHQSKSEPRPVAATSLTGPQRKMPQLPIRAHMHGPSTISATVPQLQPQLGTQHRPQPQTNQRPQTTASIQPSLPHHSHHNLTQPHQQNPYPPSALSGSMIENSHLLPAPHLTGPGQPTAQGSALSSSHHVPSSHSTNLNPNVNPTTSSASVSGVTVSGSSNSGRVGTIAAPSAAATAPTTVTSSATRKLPFQRQKSRELPLLEGILSQSATVDTGNVIYPSPKKHLPRVPQSSLAKSTGNLYQLEQLDLSAPNISSSNAYTQSVPSDSHSYSGEGFYAKPGGGVGGKGSSSLSSLYHYQKKSSGQFNLARTSGIGSGRSLPGPFGDIGDSGVGDSLMLRTDSLSSDQSEMVRRSPVRSQYQTKSLQTSLHHHQQQQQQQQQLHPKLRLRDGRRFRLYKSLSSSEDEVRSTPDFSTEDDFDMESESYSEHALGIGADQFHRSRALKPDEILDAKMRNFLVHPITWKLSPDGAHMIGHMILKKHLTNDLTFGSSSAMLGLKVVGGRVIESGRLGALIEKVRKGGIADTIGRLRPGDEVLEWNGISLKGKTYEEVHDLIVESRQNPQVELLISRPTNKNKLGALHAASVLQQQQQQQQQRTPAAIREQFIQQQNRIGRRHTDVLTGTGVPPSGPSLDYDKNTFTRGSSLGAELTARTSAGHHHLLPKTPQLSSLGTSLGTSTGAQLPAPPSSTAVRTQPLVKVVTRSSTISGRIQVKLWYDSQTLELMVTLLNAVELSPRKTGLSRNPYVKMYLLPDLRSERTTRRSKTAVNTNEPVWNQTFVYSPIHHTELKTKTLDITVWDYDRYCANELLGQVAIDLSTAPMSLPPSLASSMIDSAADTGEWYYLASHDEIVAQLPHHLKSHFINERFSPSPTISRLSDSELSELDYDDDYNNSRESWRGLLAETSQSSLGSSGGGSPPLATGTGPIGLLVAGGSSLDNSLSFGANTGSAPVVAPPISSSAQSLHRLGVGLRAQSSAGHYYPGSSGSAGPSTEMQPGSSRPGIGHRFHRQNRHEMLSTSSLPGSSMYLPPSGSQSQYHTQYGPQPQPQPHHGYPSMRPEFRKSSSHPTADHRSLSPPIHYQHQSATALYPGSSKRHLPSIPSSVPHFASQQQLGLCMDPAVSGLVPVPSTCLPLAPIAPIAPTAYSAAAYQQPQPSEVLGQSLAVPVSGCTPPPPPHAIYSDSEVTLKPVFGNRPLYAHPVSRDYHFSRQQRFQQQCRSTDDLHYSPHHQSQPYYQRGSGGNRAPGLSHHASLAGPVSRRAASAAYQHQHSDSLQSESDSVESAAASHAHRVNEQHQRRLSQRRHSRHSRDQHSSMVSVDYRELKNADDEEDEDYDEEEGTTTEYDELGQPQQRPVSRRRGVHHHHHAHHAQQRHHQSGQSSQQPQQQQQHQQTRRESHSKQSQQSQDSSRSHSAGDRRYSRQASSSSRHPGPSTGTDQENVPAQSQQPPQPPQQQQQPAHHHQQQQHDNSETESSNSKHSSSQSAYTGRPKGSRTLSEFTGRSQQHSGPVHPPHPSRSGLAVARSMSERSKDDGKVDSKPTQEASKSYSDQIDEVMEQLNANCDLSMDDIYGAATSASTSTLNASTSTAEKKEGKKGRKAASGDPGLTKKSNSTSQLSVTGTKKRLGFRKKQATSFSVHRSEEVLPDDVRHMVKQYSSVSSDGDGSISGDSSYTWLTTLKCEDEYSSFLGDTGPGQICSRQGLVEVDLGELQLGVCLRKNGILEVEVIRAHGLRTKYGSKLPSIYVKVYLIRDRDIVAKAKTTRSRRTLEPFFKQSLLFSDEFQGCQLNCLVYGEYGKLQRDVFMGVVQIELKDVDLPVGFTNKYFKIYSSFADIPPSTGSKITNDQDPSRILSGSGGGSGSITGQVQGTSAGSYSGDQGGRAPSLAGSGGSGPASLLSASMESFS